MSWCIEVEAARKITAKYGKCRLCGEELRGRTAYYFPSSRLAICTTHRAYVVVYEFVSGTHTYQSVCSVHPTKEEAEAEAERLNRTMASHTARTFRSYTYMSLDSYLRLRTRSGEIEAEEDRYL